MALSVGSGPFGDKPAGHFNVAPPQRPLLYWEPYPKRLRVVIGGKTVADSRQVVALHETGQMMRLCLPVAGVQAEWRPEASDLSQKPPAGVAALRDYVYFDLARVEAWYLEDELGYAHPCDPYHRVDVHRTSRHVAVRAGETVVAECAQPSVLFETSLAPRFYLPPDAVRIGLLEKSKKVSQCPYKGDGQHWHVVVGGRRIADAAWSLTTPIGDALAIPRWFSFYAEKLSIEVDGQALEV